jgi:anti-sigma B factor antagonist
MFGKFRRNGNGNNINNETSGTPRRGPHHFGFGETNHLPPNATQASPLASYDRLGQTLVGTPMTDALTGPDAGRLASELYEQIRSACEDPHNPAGIRHVVLDLQNVQYMDSMCVGVLVELLTTLKEAGGRIALANASSNIECLFKLTRLDRVFPICRDVMKAIDVVEREG